MKSRLVAFIKAIWLPLSRLSVVSGMLSYVWRVCRGLASFANAYDANKSDALLQVQAAVLQAAPFPSDMSTVECLRLIRHAYVAGLDQFGNRGQGVLMERVTSPVDRLDILKHFLMPDVAYVADDTDISENVSSTLAMWETVVLTAATTAMLLAPVVCTMPEGLFRRAIAWITVSSGDIEDRLQVHADVLKLLLLLPSDIRKRFIEQHLIAPTLSTDVVGFFAVTEPDVHAFYIRTIVPLRDLLIRVGTRLRRSRTVEMLSFQRGSSIRMLSDFPEDSQLQHSWIILGRGGAPLDMAYDIGNMGKVQAAHDDIDEMMFEWKAVGDHTAYSEHMDMSALRRPWLDPYMYISMYHRDDAVQVFMSGVNVMCWDCTTSAREVVVHDVAVRRLSNMYLTAHVTSTAAVLDADVIATANVPGAVLKETTGVPDVTATAAVLVADVIATANVPSAVFKETIGVPDVIATTAVCFADADVITDPAVVALVRSSFVHWAEVTGVDIALD